MESRDQLSVERAYSSENATTKSDILKGEGSVKPISIYPDMDIVLIFIPPEH